MIPKVEACLTSLEAGVLKTHIIDGRLPHALLLEIFTHERDRHRDRPATKAAPIPRRPAPPILART